MYRSVLRDLIFAWIAVVLLAIMTEAALSHQHGPGSWINNEKLIDPITKQWCCDEFDCKPQPAGAIKPVEGGYLVVETGEVIEHRRVIWRSPDGMWWRCAIGNVTRCLIGPPRSF